MSEGANREERNPYAKLTPPPPTAKIYYQIQHVKVS